MTVSINLKPSTKTIKIEGYGEFTVRPMGASEELDLARMSREIQEMTKNIENMDEYIKAEEEGDTEKVEEGKEKLREANVKIQEFRAAQIELLKARVSCKKPELKELLFTEIPFKELNEAIAKALSEEENV